MQKLTRTQKYADLRDQLANDKEANISSDDLTGYQNRLDAVQETLTPNQGRAEETFKQESEYVFDSYNQNQVGSNQSYEKPKDDSYFDSFMNTSQDVKAGGDFNSYFESESKEDEYNIDNIFSEVFADVKDSTAEAIVKNERENYLNQAIDDANIYTNANGERNTDQIVNDLVNEVRHSNETAQNTFEAAVNVNDEVIDDVVDNIYAWTSVEEQPLDAEAETAPVTDEIADEQFTSTVSMEVSKIMDEITDMPVQRPAVEEKTEDVIEIKNIAEMESEPVKDTVSSTIPFVVASSDEDEIEDDEEESPNTVLNIILIVLIVALIAVLGLIVFYILKTKGIF